MDNMINDDKVVVANPKTVKTISIGATVSVFAAYACGVSPVPNGAFIAEGSTFSTGAWGIVLGFIIGTILCFLISWMGYKTGVGKDIFWKAMFGRHGFRICSLAFAFCQSFWGCSDFFNGGQALYNLMPEGSIFKNMGFCIAILIITALTILGGVFQIDGVKWISAVTIPVALILFILILVLSYNTAGGIEGLQAYVPVNGATLNVFGCAQIMLSMWMAAFVGAIDLTPSAKNTKAVALGSVSAVGIIMLCLFMGQIGFIGAGVKTVADLCLYFGGAIFIVGNIFVVIAQGNTAPACNMMYANSYSEGLRLPRTPLAIIVPIIVAILSFVIMYGPGVDFILNITNVVGILMAPLNGVMIAEFYIVKKCKLELKEDEKDYPVIKPSAIISLLAGFALSIFYSSTSLPLPCIWTLVSAGVLHLILHRIIKK